MDRETSSHASTIAAKYMTFGPANFAELLPVNLTHTDEIQAFCTDVRTLAASALSQDQTPGQAPPVASTFLDRLNAEREQLSERYDKLGAFIKNGTPGVTDPQQIELLTTQHAIMEQYLRVLTLRSSTLQPAGTENNDAQG